MSEKEKEQKDAGMESRGEGSGESKTFCLTAPGRSNRYHEEATKEDNTVIACDA